MEQGTNDRKEYENANDRNTFMTDLEKLLSKLEVEGYTEQYRVENDRLVNLKTDKKHKADDIKVANFYRFEGISNPDDMSILYAIETCTGEKGTLVDAYGLYSDDDTHQFFTKVETHKKVHGTDVY